MKILYTCILFLLCSTCFGQVGINTETPQADLDVNGDVIIDQKLYLENPGDNLQIRNSKLLILTPQNDLLKYDIEMSKYGPINYSQFVFDDLNEVGLQNYDTKISSNDYLVSIQGYYFLEAGTSNPEVVLRSNASNKNIEGYQIFAYKNLTTGTWWLKAFGNNSKFKIRNSSGNYVNTNVDLYLNIIIYRNNFISKEQSAITVDMDNNETATAPLPSGF